jgi:uncharacterized protein
MKFAVNYSPLLAELVSAGMVALDYFKCPAWPDLLVEAQKTRPVYIHFPLSIGYGQGNVMDEETHLPADLDRFARMMDETGTAYINTHFIIPATAYPDIPRESRQPEHIRQLLDGALRDLAPLLKRFGPEKVLVENIINEPGWINACVFPEVITSLLEQSGCRFLFDLSHARLSAENMKMDPQAYIAGLPMRRLGECHVTGLHKLEGSLLEMMISIGDPYGLAAHQAGKRIDHLPMEADDWPDFTALLAGIEQGQYAEPGMISFEYGGVGPFWDQVTNREVYLTQVPRMAALIKGVRNVGSTRK